MARFSRVLWIRVVLVAFGVFNLVIAGFWTRMAEQARRSGERVSFNARAILGTRIAGYFSSGVFFTLLGLYRAQWLAWAGISAIIGRLVVDAWFQRRERRNGEAASTSGL